MVGSGVEAMDMAGVPPRTWWETMAWTALGRGLKGSARASDFSLDTASS